MNFIKTEFLGLIVIESTPSTDSRGFFTRTWCQKEFSQNDINISCVQSNLSSNKHKHTIRGMHYQTKPHEEIKLVRCIQGSIMDIALDIRPESPTYKKYFSIKLRADNFRSLLIPKGFAHGFQTLEDNSTVFYQMSEYYHPECAKGLRWNDPCFNIKWPNAENPVISKKDMTYQDFKD